MEKYPRLIKSQFPLQLLLNGYENYPVSYILADFNYWAENLPHALYWLEENDINYYQQGIGISFTNEEDAILFKLRWYE